MRLMALDFGAKRVGIASTDETGEFALPRVVIPNDENLLQTILEFKMKEGIERVVIGESRNLDGSPNAIMKDAAKFKEALEKSGVETVFHPEFYSTVEARHLQGNNSMTDASAAAIVLKSYIDSQNRQ